MRRRCFRRDAGGTFALRPLEDVLQLIQVIVLEDAEFRATKTRGIDDAGVDEFVSNDDVLLVEQGANGAEGSGVAGGKTERGFDALEGGQGFLQFVMRRERTANEPRCAGAGAEVVHSLLGGLFEGGMVGQADRKSTRLNSSHIPS